MIDLWAFKMYGAIFTVKSFCTICTLGREERVLGRERHLSTLHNEGQKANTLGWGSSSVVEHCLLCPGVPSLAPQSNVLKRTKTIQ